MSVNGEIEIYHPTSTVTLALFNPCPSDWLANVECEMTCVLELQTSELFIASQRDFHYLTFYTSRLPTIKYRLAVHESLGVCTLDGQKISYRKEIWGMIRKDGEKKGKYWPIFIHRVFISYVFQ